MLSSTLLLPAAVAQADVPPVPADIRLPCNYRDTPRCDQMRELDLAGALVKLDCPNARRARSPLSTIASSIAPWRRRLHQAQKVSK